MLRRCAGYVGIALCMSLMASMHIRIVGAQEEKVFDIPVYPAEYQGSVVDACKLLCQVCWLGINEQKLSDASQRARLCRLRDNAMGALQYALAAGRNVDEKDKEGHAGLYILTECLYAGSACSHEQFLFSHVISKAMLTLICAGAEVKKEGCCFDDTPLHLAAKYGCVELVEPLVRAGIAVDAKTRWQCTPLRDAVLWTHVRRSVQKCNASAVVALLLDLDADPNYKDCVGRTLLHYAAEYASEGDVARLLITHKAHVNELDHEYLTPLMLAARVGNSAAISLLLEAGALIDAQSKDGYTALIMATNRRAKKTVDLLLAAKASTALVGYKGGTALRYAQMSNYQEIVEVLEKAAKEEVREEGKVE